MFYIVARGSSRALALAASTRAPLVATRSRVRLGQDHCKSRSGQRACVTQCFEWQPRHALRGAESRPAREPLRRWRTVGGGRSLRPPPTWGQRAHRGAAATCGARVCNRCGGGEFRGSGFGVRDSGFGFGVGGVGVGGWGFRFRGFRFRLLEAGVSGFGVAGFGSPGRKKAPSRAMLYGVWCIVYGVGCRVKGLRCMEYGVGCMV